MPEHKMVTLDGVRYRPEDVPNKPKHSAVTEPAGESGSADSGVDTAGITTVDDDGDKPAPAKRTSAAKAKD